MGMGYLRGPCLGVFPRAMCLVFLRKTSLLRTEVGSYCGFTGLELIKQNPGLQPGTQELRSFLLKVKFIVLFVRFPEMWGSLLGTESSHTQRVYTLRPEARLIANSAFLFKNISL